MKKILLILGIFVIMSAFTHAESELFDELNAKYSEYDVIRMPGPVNLIFGTERINIHVGDHKFSVVTEEGFVAEFKEGHLDDPTMDVYVKEETVRKVLDAENPVMVAKEAYKNKEFSYEGVGAGKKTKLFFVKIAAKIASWFM